MASLPTVECSWSRVDGDHTSEGSCTETDAGQWIGSPTAGGGGGGVGGVGGGGGGGEGGMCWRLTGPWALRAPANDAAASGAATSTEPCFVAVRFPGTCGRPVRVVLESNARNMEMYVTIPTTTIPHSPPPTDRPTHPPAYRPTPTRSDTP